MAKMPLASQIDKALAVLAAQTKPVRYIVRKPRRGGKRRGGKLRAGRLAQWKARKIEEALRRHDERDLSELVLQGYVLYDPQTYEYSLSPAYAEAYRAALAGAERSKRAHRVSSRARAGTMRDLGMRRTRSGGWE